MKKKFKPCPYCGEVKVFPASSEMDDFKEHRVVCQNCGALGPWADTCAGAIDAWNKREGKGEWR